MVSNHKSVSMGVRSPTEIDRFEACLPEPVPGMIRGDLAQDFDSCIQSFSAANFQNTAQTAPFHMHIPP